MTEGAHGSISSSIDELCSDKVRDSGTHSEYTETSYDGITELSDVVNRTEGAEKVVAPSIHKHLEGDSIHAQKRALTVLEGLVEMGTPQFQRMCIFLTAESFATPELRRAIVTTARSITTDNGVRRKLMLILLSWHRHFMRDPEMTVVTSLYGLCGGVDRKPTLPNEVKAMNTPNKPAHNIDIHGGISHGFSSVDGTIESTNGETSDLLAAMLDAKQRNVPLLEDPTVRTHTMTVLELQKSIVRFIHTVNDEDYLSRLVLANDKIVDVLQRLQMLESHPLGTEQQPKEDIIMGAARRLSLIDNQTVATPVNEVPAAVEFPPASLTTGEDHILGAARRLSLPNVQDGEGPVNSLGLAREVDRSLLLHSGFTSAAPSRAAIDNQVPANPNEIDMDVVARNTENLQGSVSSLNPI